jgi:hypothetical protein
VTTNIGRPPGNPYISRRVPDPFSCFDPDMEERVIVSFADLAERLAWGLHRAAWLLPEAPRKGRLRISFEQCRAIARRQVEELERTGIVEVRRRAVQLHSSPAECEEE